MRQIPVLLVLLLAARAAGELATLGDFVSPFLVATATDDSSVYQLDRAGSDVSEAVCAGLAVLRKHDPLTGKVVWRSCVAAFAGRIAFDPTLPAPPVAVVGTSRTADNDFGADVVLETFHPDNGTRLSGPDVVVLGTPPEQGSSVLAAAIDASIVYAIRNLGGGDFVTVPGLLRFSSGAAVPGFLDDAAYIGDGRFAVISSTSLDKPATLLILDAASATDLVVRSGTLPLPPPGTEVNFYLNLQIHFRRGFLWVSSVASTFTDGSTDSGQKRDVVYVQKLDFDSLKPLWTNTIWVTRDDGRMSDPDADRLPVNSLFAPVDVSEIDLLGVGFGIDLSSVPRHELFTVWSPQQGVTFFNEGLGDSNNVIAGLNATDGTLMTAFVPKTKGADQIEDFYVLDDGTIAIAGVFDGPSDFAPGPARTVISFPRIWARNLVVDGTPMPSPDVVDESPMPSPDVVDESPMPSPDVVDESPMPSPDVVDESPMPSPDVVDESPMPLPDILAYQAGM